MCHRPRASTWRSSPAVEAREEVCLPTARDLASFPPSPHPLPLAPRHAGKMGALTSKSAPVPLTTPSEPSHATTEALASARFRLRAPVRLPDEVVIMTIEWCDYLPCQRTTTLAALCRLSRRYTVGAQRALYSRVSICTDGTWYGPGHGAASALIGAPHLHPWVRSVELRGRGAPSEEHDAAEILGLLPSVDELVCRYRRRHWTFWTGSFRRIASGSGPCVWASGTRTSPPSCVGTPRHSLPSIACT